jgi:hypothetical protein
MFRFELRDGTSLRNAGEVSEIGVRSQISVANCKAYNKDKSKTQIKLHNQFVPTVSFTFIVGT